ncbi:MAG: MBOAT family protein [Lachnospiraceae bacterium]|nr:MBOAT family protein [Lachnospiraceae bacterium]
MIQNVKKNNAQNIILLLACYAFYGFFDLRGLVILIALSVFTYLGGKNINESLVSGDDKRAGMYCAMFITTQIGVLCFFKYSAAPLPVGMSFYLLMAVSFLVDCKKGCFRDFPSVAEVLIFISFFPTILSGPILKAHEFIPQISSRQKISKERFTRGIWLTVIGLFMKLCMADRLGVAVDKVYETPLVFSGMTLFITSVGYSLQLFFDFAGYSNMAIGVATLLGFDIPANFNLPYMSTNPSAFWTRWHISLSSWLREYVYIPLGGNRKGKNRTYINIMIVMIISGLWHGSTINFLVWGILHGLGQLLHRLIFGNKKDAPASKAWRIPSMILNFLFIDLLWIPFRARTLSDTLIIIKRIVTFAEGASYYYVYTFIFGIILLIVQFIGARYNDGNDPIKPLSFDKMYARVIFLVLIIATAMFAYFGNGAFIYSQF